jgi:circadian clock protein KaiB
MRRNPGERIMNRRSLFKFRLYTADGTQNSAQALANLTALCRVHLPNRFEIEVIDVFREPERARADGVRMTPTLIKLSPAPICRIVGSLGKTRNVLVALGMEVVAA